MYEIIIHKGTRKLAHFKTESGDFEVKINDNTKTVQLNGKNIVVVANDMPQEIQKIIDAVREATGVHDFLINTRRGDIRQARQYAQFFAWLLYWWDSRKYSIQSLASWIGRKEHATVLHSVKVCTNDMLLTRGVRGMAYKVAMKLGCLALLNEYLKKKYANL